MFMREAYEFILKMLAVIAALAAYFIYWACKKWL